VMALLWPLYAWSAWAQPATVGPGTAIESADLASVRSVGAVSASRGGGVDKR
jgi:hypothetical protein